MITFIDISVARAQEKTLRETLPALQGRFVEQLGELDRARTLELVPKKAQAILYCGPCRHR